MKKHTAIIALVMCALCGLLLQCASSDLAEDDQPNEINLIWNKSYPTQTLQDVKRGLIWDLSWLGAELPKGSFEKACKADPADSTRFTINLDSVGFNPEARIALRRICDSIRNSEEYGHYNGLDVGKFITLTLGSSWHYYAITGAPKTLNEFRTRYHIDTTAFVYGVTQSSISEGHRRIFISRDTALFHCGFMAEEGSGSLTDQSFQPVMYECFDIMPNGQLRCMIYDAQGQLAAGTPAAVGDAGKPAKCLWCHETVIQPLFIENHAVAGMLTDEEFLSIRDAMQQRLERYRLTLHTDMNWSSPKEHTLGELLYITYMEPTLMHLQHEWNLSPGDAETLLLHAAHHPFREFDYIGEVYERAEMDALDSMFNLPVPASVRETEQEVNYLR